jgi:hypothetical protein
MAKMILILLLVSAGMAHAATHAAMSSRHAWLAGGGPCPLLVTPAECGALRAAYAALTSAAARAAWLREHDAFMRDREEACLCVHQDLLLTEHRPTGR